MLALKYASTLNRGTQVVPKKVTCVRNDWFASKLEILKAKKPEITEASLIISI
jgi:hypothetical protein